ncbi:hypothetical protein IGI47_001927 [Enterococcus sp. AZ191]|uniref:hypothetical protein n=1 Tax=Enterococcus sp. AZ191 TaxID=2774639 RepID=UPI003F21E070
MQKIIEGKKYDTETATLIATYEYSNQRDFNYCLEELYQTKKGAFFMYGEGGPLSKYAKEIGNNTTSGSCEIYLVSEEEAKEFAMENLGAEDFEEIFGEVEEG